MSDASLVRVLEAAADLDRAASSRSTSRNLPKGVGVIVPRKTKKAPTSLSQGEGTTSGNDLLSRAVSRGVPSALEGLTSVFEMGTGVTPPT